MNARATLQQELHRTGPDAFDATTDVPPRGEHGFTIVDVMVAVALVAVLALVALGGLTHRSGEVNSVREPLVAYLAMARAHAATQGRMDGSGGATVVVATSAETTTLTLYDGHPEPGTTLIRTRRAQNLSIPGRLDLNNHRVENYALIFGPDGTTTAMTPYVVGATPAVTRAIDDACGSERRLALTYVSANATSSFTVDCTTGAVDAAATASPRRYAD